MDHQPLPNCRRLPVLRSPTVSVTFRGLLPNEFVVRYVHRAVRSLRDPLRCSIDLIVERKIGMYSARLRGPGCMRTDATVCAPDLMTVVRATLDHLDWTHGCSPVIDPDFAPAE